MLRTVLDTNIIVSALLKPEGLEDQILRLGLAGRIKLCVSPAILDECGVVLSRPKFKLKPHEVARALGKLRQVSLLVHPSLKLNVSSHEPDNRFLECATASRADFLITGNKRHFPDKLGSTRIVNSREFITLIA